MNNAVVVSVFHSRLFCCYQGRCRKQRQVLKEADYKQISAGGATVSICYSWSANTQGSTSMTTRQSQLLNMLTDDR